MSNEKICFLICPIGSENSETRNRSDKLVNYLLKPICDKCNYKLIRSDKIKNNDQIDDTIISYLDTADLVIADITELNPNVFYELGYSNAKNGKRVIQISDESINSIPFDRITTRTFRYNFDISIDEKFKSDIIDVIKNIEESNDIQKSISENKSDENTFNKSFSAVLSYLDRLDKSYRLIEEISVKNNQMISNLEKTISSKYKEKSATKNHLDDATNLKLMEMLIQNPESLKAAIALMNGSDSTSDNNS